MFRCCKKVSPCYPAYRLTNILRPYPVYPPLAGPRNFPDETLPHIALIFCILRAYCDWMQTFYAPNHRSALTQVLLFIVA